jgi:hypothetical protein
MTVRNKGLLAAQIAAPKASIVSDNAFVSPNSACICSLWACARFSRAFNRCSVSAITFAPGSLGSFQDSDGGGGCNRPSPLFSPSQRRAASLLSLNLSCIRARSRDVIVSSNRSLNCSLSRGSRPRIVHRSTVDSRVSCAFRSSFDISFIDGLLMPIPLAGGVRFIQRMSQKSPTDSRSRIFRFQRCERLDGTSGSIHRGIFAFMKMIFCGDVLVPKGFNLPKNSVSCPITSPELRVIRQSPLQGRVK